MSDRALTTTQKQAATRVSPSISGFLQRKCACGQHTMGGECAACKDKKGLLQRKPANEDVVGEVPSVVHEVLRSPGQPLDPATRAFMEPRFGHDFSGVRVHTNAKAAKSARAVNALAYTVGCDVVFGLGQYVPGTNGGKRLLAHELTHVVQQSTGRCSSKIQSWGEGGNEYEQEAETISAQVMGAVPKHELSISVPLVASAVPVGIMRAPDKCLDDCNEQFERCVKYSQDSARCVSWRSACYMRCPPSSEPKEPEKPEPKKECTAPHPVNLHTVGRLAASKNFGFVTIHTWKSSTNKLEDLKDCKITEFITYSKIPNPPYGGEDGKTVAESGRSERINEISADGGKGKDTHRTPSEWIRKPPSEGSFTVTQTYDYKCANCGDEWVPFAHYIITSKTHKEGNQWKHYMTKVGSEEQDGDSVEIDEEIS